MTPINVCAFNHFDYFDSYGLIASQLTRHLTALGCAVNPYRRPGAQFKNLPADIAEIVKRENAPAVGGIFMGFPGTFHEHGEAAREHPRIAITMFESTIIPQDWAAILNEFDAVVVPGQFCRDLFRQNGITAPVHAIPLGISDTYRVASREPDRPLTFMAFGGGARKGGITALNAFLRAFGDDMNYRLIIKSRKLRQPFTLTNPNVDWIQQDMTEEELHQLYLQADVMIAATHGEGFGLLPREFAATGGIALATAWGGTADDLDQWGWPLPYALAPADWGDLSYLEPQDFGEWAKPDEVGIAERLKEVAANITMLRATAYRRAPRIAEMYSWRKFAEGVLGVWEQVSQGEKVMA